MLLLQKYVQFQAGRLEQLNKSEIRFFGFLETNPGFIHDFAQLALDRITHGYKRYRARLIMGRLRWDYETRYKDRASPVLLNDHYTPKIARLLTECEVVPPGFFEFRTTARKRAIAEHLEFGNPMEPVE